MFKRPAFELNSLSWLVFGLPGVALSMIVLFAPKATAETNAYFFQTISLAIVLIFISVQLLILWTSESIEG